MRPFRKLDDGWGVSNALLGLAQAALARGDSAPAAKMLVESEALARAAGDWFTLSANLSDQALAAHLRGEEERAASRFRECLSLAAKLRDAWTVGLSASGLAGVAASQGRTTRSARLFGAAGVTIKSMRRAITSPFGQECLFRQVAVSWPQPRRPGPFAFRILPKNLEKEESRRADSNR
jgi:hypothetical protein